MFREAFSIEMVFDLRLQEQTDAGLAKSGKLKHEPSGDLAGRLLPTDDSEQPTVP